MLEVVSDAGPHVCPACGEVKIRTTDPKSVPRDQRWGVRRYHPRTRKVQWQPRCHVCEAALRQAYEDKRNGRRRVTNDVLGHDPYYPIGPFREWLQRVVDRYDRLYGNGDGRSALGGQSGAREAIAGKLATELGGQNDRWSRMIFRALYEQTRIRLSLADRVLLTLDFDGTTLDDLWPISDEECAA